MEDLNPNESAYTKAYTAVLLQVWDNPTKRGAPLTILDCQIRILLNPIRIQISVF